MTLVDDGDDKYNDWSKYSFSMIPKYQETEINQAKTNQSNGVYQTALISTSEKMGFWATEPFTSPKNK